VTILQGFTAPIVEGSITPQPAKFDFGSIQNVRLSVGLVIDFDLGRVKRTPTLGQR